MAARGRPRRTAARSEPPAAMPTGTTASRVQPAEPPASEVPARPVDASHSRPPVPRPNDNIQIRSDDAGPSTRPAPAPRSQGQEAPAYAPEELQLLTHPIVRRVMQETVNEAIALYAQTVSIGARTHTQTHAQTTCSNSCPRQTGANLPLPIS
jgi:hypothetical protein